MSKKYTKKQITEAIAYWEKQLDKLNESDTSITDEQWEEAYHWFEQHGFDVHDSDEGGFTFYEPINGKDWYNGKDGYALYKSLRAKGVSRTTYEDFVTQCKEDARSVLDAAHVSSDELDGLDDKVAKLVIGLAATLVDDYGKYYRFAKRVIDFGKKDVFD